MLVRQTNYSCSPSINIGTHRFMCLARGVASLRCVPVVVTGIVIIIVLYI